MERLQKFISNSGYTSRRKAEDLIVKGKVKVDGEVITELGFKVTGKEMVEVEGHILEKEEKVYYVLNKPSGYITAVEDDKGRRVVTDLISTDKRVFPVGRLDYDTAGVLFLTNDGEFSQSMTSPDFKIEKEYIATMKGRFNSYHRRMLMTGVDIGGYVTKKAKIDIISYDKKTDKSQVGIVITEGKYHQVKKMFETQGFIVSRLKRVRFGVVTDKNIRIGDYRRIKPHEIKRLYELSKRGE